MSKLLLILLFPATLFASESRVYYSPRSSELYLHKPMLLTFDKQKVFNPTLEGKDPLEYKFKGVQEGKRFYLGMTKGQSGEIYRSGIFMAADQNSFEFQLDCNDELCKSSIQPRVRYQLGRFEECADAICKRQYFSMLKKDFNPPFWNLWVPPQYSSAYRITHLITDSMTGQLATIVAAYYDISDWEQTFSPMILNEAEFRTLGNCSKKFCIGQQFKQTNSVLKLDIRGEIVALQPGRVILRNVEADVSKMEYAKIGDLIAVEVQ